MDQDTTNTLAIFALFAANKLTQDGALNLTDEEWAKIETLRSRHGISLAQIIQSTREIQNIWNQMAKDSTVASPLARAGDPNREEKASGVAQDNGKSKQPMTVATELVSAKGGDKSGEEKSCKVVRDADKQQEAKVASPESPSAQVSGVKLEKKGSEAGQEANKKEQPKTAPSELPSARGFDLISGTADKKKPPEHTVIWSPPVPGCGQNRFRMAHEDDDEPGGYIQYEFTVDEAMQLISDNELPRFTKAFFKDVTNEPEHSDHFARMVKIYSYKKPRFRQLFLQECQDEFEKREPHEGLNVESRKLEMDRERDFAKKLILGRRLADDMSTAERRFFGVVTLIGELYKNGLLIPRVIASCMMRLIEEANNDNIDRLCFLLITAGDKLATEKEDQIRIALKYALTVLQDISQGRKTKNIQAFGLSLQSNWSAPTFVKVSPERGAQRRKQFALNPSVKSNIQATLEASKNWQPMAKN